MKRLVRAMRLLAQPCEQMVELVSQSLDSELSFSERLAMRSHMLYCKACRRCRRQLLALREVMQRLTAELEHAEAPADTPGLSPEVRERIKKALGSE